VIDECLERKLKFNHISAVVADLKRGVWKVRLLRDVAAAASASHKPWSTLEGRNGVP
jgi:hypothetical protein